MQDSWANSKQSNQMLNEDQLAGSLDWREEDNEKVLYKNPKIKDLFPVNYWTQMDTFFQKNEEYNPHFFYKTIVSPELLPLHTQYESLANKILLKNTYDHSSLPVLSKEQVIKIIEEYLQNLGLSDYVELKFENNCLSRTSVAFYKEKAVIKIRTPLEYNKVNLEGVLNHQIGTHIIRRLNHKQNCIRKPSEKGKMIEEGLAAINQLLPEDKPFLFKAALRYIAAIYASKMTFSQIYKKLLRHIKDKNDCWRETVRVKRGIANTQEFGGYYKDQAYFVGAIQILKNRKQINFRKIFFGKLDPSETANLQNGVLPPFLDTEEKYRGYLKKLQAIALCNFVD